MFLDGQPNPWQESRDAGVDGKVLLATALSKPFADDPNKNVDALLIYYCEWSATVSLEVKHGTQQSLTTPQK